MANIELNAFFVNADDLSDSSEGSDLGTLSDGDIERTDNDPDAQQAADVDVMDDGALLDALEAIEHVATNDADEVQSESADDSVRAAPAAELVADADAGAAVMLMLMLLLLKLMMVMLLLPHLLPPKGINWGHCE